MKKLEFLYGDFSWNKIGKDRFVILLICGLLLLVIFTPTKKMDEKMQTIEVENERKTNSSQKKQETSMFGDKEDSYNINYSYYMEKRLEEILSCVEGAGAVKVLVTIKQSETMVVEKDIPNERKNVYETGVDGANKNTMELTNDTETVYTEDENGHKVPFVTSKLQPEIAGVLVVAKGAGDEGIKKQITEVIQALFDVEAHKIKVVKMKGEKNERKN